MDIDRTDWPALMDLRTASDYLNLARGSLLGLLSREQVHPVDVGAKLRRWRRRDLDNLIERLPAYGAGRPAAPPAAPGTDVALAAVERRALRRQNLGGGRRS